MANSTSWTGVIGLRGHPTFKCRHEAYATVENDRPSTHEHAAVDGSLGLGVEGPGSPPFILPSQRDPIEPARKAII
jgi:hypothetical protein